MKRKILIFIIVSLLLVATAFLKKSFSAVNVNVEKKYSFLDNIQKKANITSFTIYGRFFNLEGYINENNSDLTLVFKNDDLETEYSLNLEPTTNKTIFKTNTLINEGINLEELKQGEYLLLLKSKKNDKVIYYNLINDTKYKNLEYYTITKAGKNNKIDISFANNLNKNLFLSCKEENLPDTYYDIVIDPGHGGKDVGASKNGYFESKINLDYALKLKESLENLGLKVKLTREKDISIANYGKNSRTSIPYETKAKLMLSVHQNSSVKNVNKGGLEIYIPNHTNKEFAFLVVNNIKKYTTSPISKNTSFKIDEGIYLKTLDKTDLEAIKKEAEKNNYKPYEKATTDSTYYYMIREVGGIITNSYIDLRNPNKPGNIYYNSNHGTEAYLLELGYLNSSSNLKILLNEKDEFVKAISLSVKEYLNI